MNTDDNILDDRRLVERHLAGDRGVFELIVRRHQNAICALAYIACGDVGRSEDVAQEVFVTAWRKLEELREPEKLRGWLCGIARNHVRSARRSDRRTPTARAEEFGEEREREAALLDAATSCEVGHTADHADPAAQAISADEAALMWRALEGLPEDYREPMVLFYREQCAVSAVAETLEISEELVRQRLVRGRAMLNERMAKFVEDALARTAPTKAFSAAVLVSLPAVVGPGVVLGEAGAAGGAAGKALATAGALGSAAMKGGLAFKLLAGIALLPTLITGLTDYRRFRSQFDAQASETDRRRVLESYVLPNLAAAFLFLGIVALMQWGGRLQREHGVVFGWLVVAALGVPLAIMGWKGRCDQRRGGVKPVVPAFEYASGWRPMGLPWLHVTTHGEKGSGGRRVAKGWIAISDHAAVGLLVAGAPMAVAPVSFGGVGVGIFSVGGAVAGVAALGGLAVGGWAAGIMALAWRAAWGWLAVAHDFATGGILRAAHAYDDAAAAYFAASGFSGFVSAAWRMALWATVFAWVPAVLLTAWQLWRMRIAKERKGGRIG